ncbi:GNAT family N-acetyltransferase [Brachybacterium sp. EF45031]|uniref:GNAT family N-acetyltransferase n=1 Tax=Brachybacterium sillae TaxID=2810536 RepID=UPI00217E8187|nr:GNAT family N-acetyltransferase [Brachybacterium sillae]MCS6712522.1 GNAT family N-acetyltransferase [Brachybacterium sillae]
MPPVPGNRPVIRPARAEDVPFLWEMLDHAANWNTMRARSDVRTVPELSHYVEGWTPDQGGVVASLGGRDVGAAWLRYLPFTDPGYGYLEEDVPELTIGLDPVARGRGIGRALLQALTDQAIERGVERVSLSVEPQNTTAMVLYLSEGFTRTGIVVGGSDILVKRLRGAPS